MILRRLVLLYTGLLLYGVSSALMVRAHLGLDAWNVLHQGLADRLGLPFGVVIIAVGALLMVLWMPLRQRPGIGTLSNVALVGLVADAALGWVGEPRGIVGRAALLACAVGLNGAATGMYMGAGFGAGPRDGLMTGLAKRTGWSIRRARTSIELLVLGCGLLLGGDVGIGTLLYALAIGPIVHRVLPTFRAAAGGDRHGPDPSAPPPIKRPAPAARAGRVRIASRCSAGGRSTGAADPTTPAGGKRVATGALGTGGPSDP